MSEEAELTAYSLLDGAKLISARMDIAKPRGLSVDATGAQALLVGSKHLLLQHWGAAREVAVLARGTGEVQLRRAVNGELIWATRGPDAPAPQSEVVAIATRAEEVWGRGDRRRVHVRRSVLEQLRVPPAAAHLDVAGTPRRSHRVDGVGCLGLEGRRVGALHLAWSVALQVDDTAWEHDVHRTRAIRRLVRGERGGDPVSPGQAKRMGLGVSALELGYGLCGPAGSNALLVRTGSDGGFPIYFGVDAMERPLLLLVRIQS